MNNQTIQEKLRSVRTGLLGRAESIEERGGSEFKKWFHDVLKAVGLDTPEKRKKDEDVIKKEIEKALDKTADTAKTFLDELFTGEVAPAKSNPLWFSGPITIEFR